MTNFPILYYLLHDKVSHHSEFNMFSTQVCLVLLCCSKDITWCQKSFFGGWNLLLNWGSSWTMIAMTLCQISVFKIGLQCWWRSNHILYQPPSVIFPEWKLGPINLAIYGSMKYSKVSKKKVYKLCHMTNFWKLSDLASTAGFRSTIYRKLPKFITWQSFKVSPLGFRVCGPIGQGL